MKLDYIVVRGNSPEKVGEAATTVWQALLKVEIEIPPECQGLCKGLYLLRLQITQQTRKSPFPKFLPSTLSYEKPRKQ